MPEIKIVDKPWRLHDLLRAAEIKVPAGIPDPVITGLTDNSRKVSSGTLFVAVRGASHDGHQYLKQAAEQGAFAAVVEPGEKVPYGVSAIETPSTRRIIGPLAHAYYGFPSRQLKVIGVTGTKGKTTITWLAHDLLESVGVPAGLVGTICNKIGGKELPSNNTTPGAIELAELLARMAERGTRACVMEVSSHALDQDRTAGVEWHAGVFTNLDGEHLDYHGTMENYLRAKLKLMQALTSSATAIINNDDPVSDQAREAAADAGAVWTYALKAPARFKLKRIESSLTGTRAEWETPHGNFSVRMPLIGSHNAENWMAAAAILLTLGIPLEASAKASEHFSGVPGRLERVDAGQPFPVFIDYAHTEGSLRRVLEELRALGKHKIITVFGCGGNRDKTKRPKMGKAAAELSDQVIITSDNPRREDPQQIASEIAQGITGSATPYKIILDRREAIQKAIESADDQSLVLIAGKGHERGQVFASTTLAFDDQQVAHDILLERR
jgi:UDP-N-acetylmuramoyl-L-alanyl-D-glutamate--2,6-diaminopimelate ligase